MTKAAAEPPEDFRSRFRRHLPRSNDLTLIVLKGHLLLEELIDGIIADSLSNPTALTPARLTIFQRLRLARALVNKVLDGPLDSAEKLNTLRNRMAHHLEPPQFERDVTAFLRTLEDLEVPVTKYEEMSTARRLKEAIAFLCGHLSGWRQGYAAVRRLDPA
jgi:hypothetical protein